MGSMHLRALRNGTVAALITAIAGFGLNAVVSSDAGSSRVEGPPSPSASPSPVCRPEARPLDRAALAGVAGRFDDVWFDTPGRGWAVGSNGDEDTSIEPVLAAWDGETWAVSSDEASLGTAALLGIDGSGADDVWAVGWSTDGFGRDTLAAHFDGTSWDVMSSAPDGELSDVRVLADDDVWAVGSLGNPDFVEEHATAMHWDGSAWTQVAVPAGGGRSGLTAIAGTADDLWAAGYHHLGALLMHYDGSRWERVDLERTRPLNGVAVDGGDVWLAGSSLFLGDASSFSSVVDAPKGGSFTDVTPLSRDAAVAVGTVARGDRSRALALEVDGATTRAARVRAPGSDGLTTAAAVRANVWLSGWHETPKSVAPLVAAFDGCS